MIMKFKAKNWPRTYYQCLECAISAHCNCSVLTLAIKTKTCVMTIMVSAWPKIRSSLIKILVLYRIPMESWSGPGASTVVVMWETFHFREPARGFINCQCWKCKWLIEAKWQSLQLQMAVTVSIHKTCCLKSFQWFFTVIKKFHISLQQGLWVVYHRPVNIDSCGLILHEFMLRNRNSCTGNFAATKAVNYKSLHSYPPAKVEVSIVDQIHSTSP